MPTNTAIAAIRAALGADDLKPVISELLAYTEQHAPRFRDEIVLHSANLNRLVTDRRKGLVDPETSRLEQTRLRAALLDVLSEIEAVSLPRLEVVQSRTVPGVAISYSWGDSAVADEIDTALGLHGVVVTRDVRDAPYRADIPAFMQQLAEARHVILLVSDRYLRSRNCMFEAIHFMEHGKFEERALPVVLPDAGDIYNATRTTQYLQFWDGEIEQLNSALKKLRSMQNADRIYQEINQFAKIRTAIDTFINRIQRMNALSLEMHRASGYKAVLTALKA